RRPRSGSSTRRLGSLHPSPLQLVVGVGAAGLPLRLPVHPQLRCATAPPLRRLRPLHNRPHPLLRLLPPRLGLRRRSTRGPSSSIRRRSIASSRSSWTRGRIGGSPRDGLVPRR